MSDEPMDEPLEEPGAEPTGEVAIIGMAGRFPQAPDLAAYWRNLRAGVESIQRFDEEELRAAGVPCELLVRYLDRHVEVDGEDHGPLAERLLDRVCAQSDSGRAAAERAARESLAARRDLWDSVLATIEPEAEAVLATRK